MAYNPSTNIVVSGKTFMDVPAVQFKTPDGATVNFAHVGGQIRFSPTLEEQTQNVANYEDVIIDPITSTLLNQLDSDFVAENIKKGVDLFGLLGTMEAGGGDFSALPQKIDTVLSGSVTPASDAEYLTIKDFGNRPSMNYLPRIFIMFRKTPASSTSYASCLFALYMSDDPLTENTTGYGGHALHLGSGANSYAMFNDSSYKLSGTKSALSFNMSGCRVSASDGWSTFKFQGGVTHYWVALCEEMSA